jgi:hypothetical protein
VQILSGNRIERRALTLYKHIFIPE